MKNSVLISFAIVMMALVSCGRKTTTTVHTVHEVVFHTNNIGNYQGLNNVWSYPYMGYGYGMMGYGFGLPYLGFFGYGWGVGMGYGFMGGYYGMGYYGMYGINGFYRNSGMFSKGNGIFSNTISGNHGHRTTTLFANNPNRNSSTGRSGNTNGTRNYTKVSSPNNVANRTPTTTEAAKRYEESKSRPAAVTNPVTNNKGLITTTTTPSRGNGQITQPNNQTMQWHQNTTGVKSTGIVTIPRANTNVGVNHQGNPGVHGSPGIHQGNATQGPSGGHGGMHHR
ncbi:MAG: hypothetical protein V4439_00255 [Patescibacteria group bacterium]